MRLTAQLFMVLLAVATLTSCVSKKKFDELLASKEAADKALAETQSRVKTLEGQNAELQKTLQSEKDRLNGEISKMQADLASTKSQIAGIEGKLKTTQAELDKIKSEINASFGAYTNSGLSLQERDGRLYVVTSEAAKFGSGSSRLSTAQRKALDELATIMQNNPNVKIMVEGHTDSKRFASGKGDNWSLSVSRAMSVVRYLIGKGVKPEQLAAAGYSEFMPVGDNATPDGRATNRRSDIKPNIDPGTFYQGN